MNVQELIEKYKKLEGVWNAEGAELARQIFLEDLKQLDEPKPVKVKQFVADVIEGAREESPELEDALHYACSNGSQEFTEWYQKKSNRDLFARAWLDGYEVEKEKRYRVKMKNMSEENTYLTFRFGRAWMLSNFEECEEFRLHHTRKQLEGAGFGSDAYWLWAVSSIGEICKQYNDDELVTEQFGLLFNWLEKQAG